MIYNFETVGVFVFLPKYVQVSTTGMNQAAILKFIRDPKGLMAPLI